MSQAAATLIGLTTTEDDLVVDPFAGSGTVLVEAQRLNRRSVGFELNPISWRITRAKTLQIAASQIERLCEKIIDDAEWVLEGRLGQAVVPSVVPASVQTKWYTPRVIANLGTLWALIHTYQGVAKLLAEVCFSSVLLPACRETRHWGYVCDNSTPKDNHSPNVGQLFIASVERLSGAYAVRDDEREALKRTDTVATSESVLCDAREAVNHLNDGSVAAIITSPPYFGVSDYIKAQRLSMEWFGFDIEPLRRNEIGARSKRHRKTAAIDYVSELSALLRALKPKLVVDGMVALVIGESSTRRVVIEELIAALVQDDFRMIFDQIRRVSEQRRQHPSLLEERIILLQATE